MAVSDPGDALTRELAGMQSLLTTHAGLLLQLGDRVVAVEAALAKLTRKLQIGAVSYYYPGAKWTALLALKPAVVVINPASGVGNSPSLTYQTQVAAAKVAGAKVFGYVFTNYALRPQADVMAEASRYRDWYGVDGIFLDETSNKPEHVPYYSGVCGSLRATNLLSCLNPGYITVEDHFKLADYVMCTEGPYTNYVNQTRPAFEKNYPGKAWHVVHSCPASEMLNAVRLANSRGAGLLWVTDDVMNNPYDTNPTYLSALDAAVRAG